MTDKTLFNDDDHRSLWLKGERLLSLLRRVEKIKSYIGKENLPSIARRYLLYHNKVDYLVAGIRNKSHVDCLINDLDMGPLHEELIIKLEFLYKNDFFLPESEKKLGY